LTNPYIVSYTTYFGLKLNTIDLVEICYCPSITFFFFIRTEHIDQCFPFCIVDIQ